MTRRRLVPCATWLAARVHLRALRTNEDGSRQPSDTQPALTVCGRRVERDMSAAAVLASRGTTINRCELCLAAALERLGQ